MSKPRRAPRTDGDSTRAKLLDAAGPRLKVVANVAVGYDNIDVAACSERGVVATNTPGVLTEATADIGSRPARLVMTTLGTVLGIGALVDADMEEASARLQALQTQQQLGIQSLSIANSASESILTLFR